MWWARSAWTALSGQLQDAPIEPIPEPDQGRLAEALALASQLHREDWRQNEPYINHPLRVATRIMSHCGIGDPDMIAVALLHDTVEDHAAELAPGGTTAAALAAVAGRFGRRVAELVTAVTNPEYEPERDKSSNTANT